MEIALSFVTGVIVTVIAVAIWLYIAMKEPQQEDR